MHKLALWVLLVLSLVGCADSVSYAPVSDISSIDPVPKKGIYKVHNGDTLYSIAWRYGLDYRYLAKINHIVAPYHIEPSQTLYLRRGEVKSSAVVQPPIISSYQPSEIEPTIEVSIWNWPAQGPIVGYFSTNNKGINIKGRIGASIYATASGKVVYSGSGLRAYGNLIIIKHNSLLLSAYAYNRKVLVKEGDWVLRGQKIAEMGRVASGGPILHFEIRREGQPVNPLSYLGKK